MPRTLIDVIPIIEIVLVPSFRRPKKLAAGWNDAQAQDALRDAQGTLKPLLGKLLDDNYELGWKFERDHRCEFCNAQWTEESTAYNGGCCDQDEAHNPESASDDTRAADMAAVLRPFKEAEAIFDRAAKGGS